MDIAETRPRTVLVAGAIGGVLLGAVVAAITPTAMIYAPDPPWRVALPAQIGETAWVPTASAPEDPTPRFADAYGYSGGGWSFPPALRVAWREPQYVPYPVPAYDPPTASEPVGTSDAAPEVERTAREAADTAAAANERAVGPPPPAAEPAPSEDEPIPADIDA